MGIDRRGVHVVASKFGVETRLFGRGFEFFEVVFDLENFVESLVVKMKLAFFGGSKIGWERVLSARCCQRIDHVVGDIAVLGGTADSLRLRHDCRWDYVVKGVAAGSAVD